MSKEAKAFFEEIKKYRPQGELTIAKVRIGLEKLLEQFPAEKDVHFQELSLGKLSCAWIHAPGCKKDKVILFLHGGGFAAGDFYSHQDFIGRMAKESGYYVFAIDYRLAPEHPFPAAVEDVLTAYHFLRKEYSPENIFVAGTSAGGGLVLSLFLKLKELKEKLPKAGICVCPWVDLALTSKTLDTNDGKDLIQKDRLKPSVDIYLQGHDPKDPLASPLYGDLKDLPPLLIQAGAHEILLGEIESLAKKAKDSEVEVDLQIYPEMFHTWQLFAAKIPEGKEAIKKIGGFIRSQ